MNSNADPRRMQLRWLLFPLIGVVAITAIFTGLVVYFGVSNASYNGPPYFGWFGWPFFGFGWIFIPIVFFLIFFGFRWYFWGSFEWRRGWGYCGRYYDPAIEALRERYARGEIKKEQFDEMTKKLLEA
ncbi:MAG: hypothetical protein JRN20_00850 [Nitrososphaerota archaeon]|nr:hypothetical protein [Nitrososphaerota archaeon]MDG6923482.1 hypothetical protein [Nitrososphaerota archaeon]